MKLIKPPLRLILIFAFVLLIWNVICDRYVLSFFLYLHRGGAIEALMVENVLFAIPVIVLFYFFLGKYVKLVKKNETAYLRMFRDNPHPMWIYSRETYQFLEVNEAAVKMYGYSQNEFLTMKILDIRPKEDIGRFLRTTSAHPEGYSASGIWKHVKKTGEFIFVNVQSYVTIYKGQSAEIVTVWDVTAQQLYEKELNDKQQLLNALINSTEDMIWAVDEQLDYLAFNDSYYNMFHQRFKQNVELGGSSRLDIFDSEVLQKRAADLYSAFSGKKLNREEVFILPGLGEVFVETTLQPIFFDERIAGVACFARDISDRKQSEIKLRESLERYELLTKTSREAIWDMDVKSQMLYWNLGLEQHFGYKERSSTAAWWYERIHKDDIMSVKNGFQQVVQEKQNVWTSKFRIRCANNSFKQVSARAYLSYNEKGVATRIVGSMEDIQQKSEYEQKLRKISLATSKTDIAILITDAQGQIEWCNDSFERLSGYEFSEVRGRRPGEVLTGPDSSLSTVRKIRKQLAVKESVEEDMLEYKKDGSPYWARLTITPILDDSGSVINNITVFKDITDLKTKMEQINQQNTALKQIAHLSSHELRGPLATILSIRQYLQEAPIPESQQLCFLNDIWKKVDELDKVIYKIIQECNELNEYGYI